MIGYYIAATVCLLAYGFFAGLSEGKAKNSGLMWVAAMFAVATMMFAVAVGETRFQEYPTDQPVLIATSFQAGGEDYYIVMWGSSYAVVKQEDLATKERTSYIEVGQTYFVTNNGIYKVYSP